MIKFFVGSENITEDKVYLDSPDDVKHLTRVLRARVGDQVVISDKEEWEYLTEIREIGDMEVITCRPADLIPDELDTLRSEMAQWSEQDEDVLSYALFPQVATDFFKYRQAQEKKVDPTVADNKNKAYPV